MKDTLDGRWGWTDARRGIYSVKRSGQEKIKITTGNKACKFEEKVLESQGRRIVKACLKEKELGIGGSKALEIREKYFNTNGWSCRIDKKTA